MRGQSTLTLACTDWGRTGQWSGSVYLRMLGGGWEQEESPVEGSGGLCRQKKGWHESWVQSVKGETSNARPYPEALGGAE